MLVQSFWEFEFVIYMVSAFSSQINLKPLDSGKVDTEQAIIKT